MDSPLATIGLPVALGIIMFGLGLSLTVQDFRNVQKHPKVVAIALVCQLLLLPAICFGLVVLWDLPPVLAVGMMLLSASPGGTSANLYSHLFRGDVALNVSLTTINSIIAIGTLPLITNLSISYFGLQDQVTLQLSKVLEVFAIVLLPVAVGMFVKAKKPSFAEAMDRPVRVASAMILFVIVFGILINQRANVGDYLASVGLITAVFCVASLVLGFLIPRGLGMTDRHSVASSFEIGIHNSTLAIYVAVEVLDSVEMSVPSAVYGLIMFFIAAVWGLLLTRVILPRGRVSASS